MAEKRWGVITGLLFGGASVALAAAGLWMQRESSPEQRLAGCLESHSVAATQPTTSSSDLDLYSGCDWPPVEGAQKDGYWEVEAQSVSLMATRSLAEFPSSIDVLYTDCREVAVRYQDYSLSNTRRSPDLLPSHRIPIGFDQALDLSTGEVGGIDSALLEEASDASGSLISGGAYVLNGKTELASARCVDPQDS